MHLSNWNVSNAGRCFDTNFCTLSEQQGLCDFNVQLSPYIPHFSLSYSSTSRSSSALLRATHILCTSLWRIPMTARISKWAKMKGLVLHISQCLIFSCRGFYLSTLRHSVDYSIPLHFLFQFLNTSNYFPTFTSSLRTFTSVWMTIEKFRYSHDRSGKHFATDHSEVRFDNGFSSFYLGFPS